ETLQEVKFFGTNEQDRILSPEEISIAIGKAHEAEDGGDYDSAANTYKNLLSSVREFGDHRLEATILIALGFNERRRGRLSETLLCYQEALTAAREAADTTLEARALNNLGVLYSDNKRTALDFLMAAAKLREQLPDKHELGETYVSIATILSGDD